MLVSSNAVMAGSYDYGEVARSVFIAIAASYAALDLTGRVTAARGRTRLAWLSGGATAMGIGIWAMHFKGMLAFHLPVSVEYRWPTVLASLLVAILASAVALYASSRHKMGPVEALTGSIFMGAGIAGMHYIGMAAMRLPAVTRYSPLLVTCSIWLAILFSLLALLMAFGLRDETRWSVPRRVGSAVVMGAAVSAMHYTGMAAASFIPAPPPDLSYAVSISPLATNGIAIVTLMVIAAAIITSSVERRTRAEVERINEDLERRVAERTKELSAINEQLRREIAERERAEEAVRRSEDHLRLVIDTIPQQIWVAPPDGRLEFCNLQFRSYVGLTLEELQGEGWHRMLHPDDLERVVRAWGESVRNGTLFEQEVRHRQADGQYRWFLVRGVPLRDSEGRIVRWYGTSTDIEDRKKADDHLQLVVDTTPAMLYTALPDGYLDFFNKRWLDYLGLSLADLGGWSWTAAIHPVDLEGLVHKWRSALATGKPYEAEARVRRSDGEYRWMLLRKEPLHDQLGNIVKWYGSGVDIEDRKRAEDTVRRSEEHLRLVIDTAPAMLLSARPDGYVDFFNKRWLEYVGVSLEDMWGWRWTNAFHPEDVEDVVGRWRSSVATGRPFEAEARLRRADGEYRLMLLRKVPLRDDAGSIVKWYGSATDVEDRKRAEDELRKQKEVFQKIFENIPVIIAFRGQDRRIEMVNPEFERAMGWTLKEIRGQNLDIYAVFFPDPDYRQRALALMAASTGEWNDLKVSVKDGRVIDVATTFLRLSDGSTLGIGQDITERKRAEQSLLLFRMLIDQSNDAIEVIDPERLRFIDINGRACLDLGYSREELLSLSVYDVDPFVSELMLAEVARKLENSGSAVFESFHRRKDGSTYPVEVSVKQVRLDRVYRVSVVRDVTERKRAEAQLRESEARFRLVADSAPVMIWVSGTDKLCTYFNKPWLDFTGRSIDQELGNGWAEGVEPEDLQRCLDTYKQAFDRREAFRMEYRLRRHDSEYRLVSDIGVPRFNPDDSFAGYIGSCIDVTEQRRAEEQLRHAQEDLARVTRVVAMGELAAAIAHEVNQPLTAIVTNANFSLRQLNSATPDPDELRGAITEIVNDGARASAVISRIRGLLMSGAPRATEVDINQVIQDVVLLLRYELDRNRISLRTELASDLPPLQGDPVQLQQVLINLIMNAIESLRASADRPRVILIRSAKTLDGVLVQVEDSGPGIGPEQADRIFEPFFTTKPQGIGMGLSISRSIVESHGGRLWAEPGELHGVRFQFTVPMADTSDESAA